MVDERSVLVQFWRATCRLHHPDDTGSPSPCGCRKTLISMLHSMLSKSSQGLLRLHSLFPVANYSVKIVVPALGDSISDGTIAAVLKKSGEQVLENETIAQVETDKVTIDIKAPSDGTILGVVVQEQDTVVPGQLVATIDDAAAQAKLVGNGHVSSQPPAAHSEASVPEAPVSPPPAATTSPLPPAAAAAAAHRIAGIRFPPRMTADGRRISMMAAAEATTIIQQWRAGAESTAGTAAAAAAADSADSAFAAWAAAQRQQQQQSSQPDVPSKFASSVTRLVQMPPRRELSARDMELIELGGAAP